MPQRLGQELLAQRNVAAANEQGRAFQVLRPAREDGSMYQIAHLLGLDAGVAEEVLGAGIDGHNPVEDAGLRIAVELDEDFSLIHG